MPDFLSAEWIDAMAAAASTAAVGPAGGDLVVQHVVTGASTGEVAWVVRVQDGKLSVDTGHDPDPSITFTLDAATAAAIQSGHQSAQAAFMSGRLRLDGDVGVLVAQQGTLLALDDVFASVRAATTYPPGSVAATVRTEAADA